MKSVLASIAAVLLLSTASHALPAYPRSESAAGLSNSMMDNEDVLRSHPLSDSESEYSGSLEDPLGMMGQFSRMDSDNNNSGNIRRAPSLRGHVLEPSISDNEDYDSMDDEESEEASAYYNVNRLREEDQGESSEVLASNWNAPHADARSSVDDEEEEEEQQPAWMGAVTQLDRNFGIGSSDTGAELDEAEQPRFQAYRNGGQDYIYEAAEAEEYGESEEVMEDPMISEEIPYIAGEEVSSDFRPSL